MSRSAGFLFALAIGCGGGKPAATTTTSTAPATGGGGNGSASCEPGRCLDDISAAVSAHKAEARACYEQGLEHKAGMAGKVFINFTIDAKGHVTETSQGMQDDQITQAEVVDCIRKVVEKITFPASPAGKTTRAYHRFEFAAH